MLEDFLSYIESNLSVNREDKILLAVSGGMDSMVMLHLFRQLRFQIEVAHINHSTRNGGSDEDMAFVQAYCEDNSIPFHSKTLNYTKLQRGNFQENARKERFTFLEQIKENRHCKWIATAHHKNDRWETFLMHLNRKSGIRGLTSLKGRTNDIIHPLLRFNQSQIIQYANENRIPFVHDKSNDSDDYLRNAIRHKITPRIETLFPEFIVNVNRSLSHLDGISSLLTELIDQYGFIVHDDKSGFSIINLKKIRAFKNQEELLYFILDEFGYNYSTVKDILSTSNTGKRFEAKDNEAIFDRDRLIIRRKKVFEKVNFRIDAPGIYSLSNGQSIIVQFQTPSRLGSHLWLDSKKIKWPLTIRGIEPGDKFKPQGMKGDTKSLKKFCTDLKINRFAKEDILLICQGNDILQVVGLRTKHGYTTDDIKNALTFNIVD